MAAKRCPFCGKKLDKKGFCQNTDCVDYKRTQMHEHDDDGGENNNGNGGN